VSGVRHIVIVLDLTDVRSSTTGRPRLVGVGDDFELDLGNLRKPPVYRCIGVVYKYPRSFMRSRGILHSMPVKYRRDTGCCKYIIRLTVPPRCSVRRTGPMFRLLPVRRNHSLGNYQAS